MELLPKSLLKDVPPLYGTESVPLAEKVVRLKLFIPWSSWTFYVVECDPDGVTAWGVVRGFCDEIGYFNVPELAAVRGPGGLTAERDLHFAPCTLAELVKRERLDLSL
jgi:hypothetical protein